MPTFRGTTNCDLRIPYKNLPPPAYPTFLPKLFANFVAIERWATYLTRNCLSASGMPQSWCSVGETTSNQVDNQWSGTVTTLAAFTSTANALLIDVDLGLRFTSADNVSISFGLTNGYDSWTLGPWVYSWPVTIPAGDGAYSEIRQTWQCIVPVDARVGSAWNLVADLTAVYGVELEGRIRVTETDCESPCCAWAGGGE